MEENKKELNPEEMQDVSGGDTGHCIPGIPMHPVRTCDECGFTTSDPHEWLLHGMAHRHKKT